MKYLYVSLPLGLFWYLINFILISVAAIIISDYELSAYLFVSVFASCQFLIGLTFGLLVIWRWKDRFWEVIIWMFIFLVTEKLFFHSYTFSSIDFFVFYLITSDIFSGLLGFLTAKVIIKKCGKM